MTLLIKGMEMPKTGVYVLSIDNTDADKTVFTVATRTNSGKIIPCYVGEAIPVPTPHGRSIDADALMLAILDAQVDQPELAEVYDEDYHVVLDWLRAAPTVIEAEE